MGLSLEQARKKIKEPENSDLLHDAHLYQQWIEFHSGFVKDLDFNFGYNQLINKISCLIKNPEKVDLIKSFIASPIATKKIISKIKKVHRKVFDGKNPKEEIILSSNEDQDAKEFINQSNIKKYVEITFEDFYKNPCSFYVVDLPSDSEEIKPYVQKVEIDKVSSSNYRGDDLEYIVFGDKDNKWVYCNEYYRTFKKVGGKWIKGIENKHNLGYCPAFQMSKPVSKDNPFQRECPLTDYLDELDYVVYYDAVLKVFEAYAPFPIISVYETDCDYKVTTRKEEGFEYYNKCCGGYLQDQDGNNIQTKTGLKKCPVCEEKNLLGPGTTLVVPQPDDTTTRDAALDSPVIKVVDIEGLKYTEEVVEKRKKSIEESISGKLDLPDNKSINESQIEAAMQRQIDSILSIKPTIEQLKIFMVESILRLRYDDSFVSYTHDLGTDFYLIGADGLMNRYNSLRESKASDSVLNFVYEEYLDSKYRSDPNKKKETLTWFKIDPWPHTNLNELKDFIELGLYGKDDLLLKANLSNAINWFKTQNNIHIFGEFLSDEKRIDLIKQKLVSYVKGQLPS